MEKIKVDVLIIIEHKSREFEGACLLKAALEMKGKKVIIDSIFPNKEILPIKYIADIIIMPWGYNDKNMQFISCFYRNNKHAQIYNWHHEQYSGQDDSNVCLPTGTAKELYHISWGNKFTNGLLNSGCKENTIITAGNIRLDFYKQLLAPLSFSKEKLAERYGIDKTKKWILFIANGYHLMNTAELSKVKSIDKNAEAKRNNAIKCRLDFLSYVKKYLSEHDDVQFIYRPHPVYANKDDQSQDVMDIKRKFSHNFYVISEQSIRHWILASDCCISFHSTCIIECAASNTPYYLFRTHDIPYSFDYSYLKNYPYKIKNYDEFCIAVEELSKYNNSVNLNRLQDYYRMDSSYAFTNIINFILSNEKHIQTHQCFNKFWYKNYIRAFIKLVIHFSSKFSIVRHILLSRKDSRWFRIVGIGDDSFTQTEVQSLVKKIKECIK